MKYSFSATLFACTFFCSSSMATANNSEPVTTTDDSSSVDKAKYWQTEGYGYVIEDRNGNLSLYDVTETATAKSCLYNRYASAEFEGNTAHYWISQDDSGQVTLNWNALHPIELTAIDELPASCASAKIIDTDPVKTFEVFWSTYADHYPYGKVQSWDWKSQYAAWRSMVNHKTSNEELAHLFSLIINRVRDGHAQLVNHENDDIGDIEPRLLAFEYRLRQAWKNDEDYRYFWPFKRDQYRKWRKLIANKYAVNGNVISHYDNFHFARLDNNIGYLRITDMMGFTKEDTYIAWLNAVDDAMQQLLPELNRGSGLVIDLRENGGGTDLVSMQLLSWLYQEKTQIGSKYTILNGKPGPEKAIWVSPSSAEQYTGPVVVLTSQGTASAAEIMLMGLTARQDTVVIGEPSNGSFSDSLPKMLPNGWGFSLSHQVYLDVNGEDHEDIGIPVSEYIPFLLFDDLEKGVDPGIERAIEILGK